MARKLVLPMIAALLALAGCGIDGAPERPEKTKGSIVLSQIGTPAGPGLLAKG
jgi:predicted small lipoprotein YifL